MLLLTCLSEAMYFPIARRIQLRHIGIDEIICTVAIEVAKQPSSVATKLFGNSLHKVKKAERKGDGDGESISEGRHDSILASSLKGNQS